MTDIDTISSELHKWKEINPSVKPGRVTVPLDLWLRIINLPIWSTPKWAAMLKGEKDLVLFGLPIKHFGYSATTEIKIET